MNNQNLRPIQLSHEEATENGRRGGIASGEARRERRRLREELEYLLEQPLPGNNAGNKSTQECLCLALIKNALQGDTRAFEIIRDTLGEKPVDNVNLRREPDYSALNRAFEELTERN